MSKYRKRLILIAAKIFLSAACDHSILLNLAKISFVENISVIPVFSVGSSNSDGTKTGAQEDCCRTGRFL
jgi:hypothetical protein